jgi:hypothetical protein
MTTCPGYSRSGALTITYHTSSSARSGSRRPNPHRRSAAADRQRPPHDTRGRTAAPQRRFPTRTIGWVVRDSGGVMGSGLAVTAKKLQGRI